MFIRKCLYRTFSVILRCDGSEPLRMTPSPFEGFSILYGALAHSTAIANPLEPSLKHSILLHAAPRCSKPIAGTEAGTQHEGKPRWPVSRARRAWKAAPVA